MYLYLLPVYGIIQMSFILFIKNESRHVSLVFSIWQNFPNKKS